MKPIERGCLCLIVPQRGGYIPGVKKLNVVSYGKAVTVICRRSDLAVAAGEPVWQTTVPDGHPGVLGNYVRRESGLIRIDDDNPDAVTEPEQREVEA